jgi:hypothetical protein
MTLEEFYAHLLKLNFGLDFDKQTQKNLGGIQTPNLALG